MLGTFGGALEARKINASEGRLTAEARGEIEDDAGVLVIRRVHVSFRLRAAEEQRSTVERVHGIYAQKCPVYRTLLPAMQITSSYELTES
ncbi:MAG TPA: OsmC family protein [Terriglobales bacterium]|nr:OsmC family protein [Terriglobales bacterium]